MRINTLISLAFSTIFIFFSITTQAQCEAISVVINTNTGTWADEMSFSIIGPIVNLDTEVAS